MSFISEILAAIAGFFLSLISILGYAGIVILMMLESMVFPVPSELVMPFVGFKVAEGQFSFILVVIASSLGSLVGSLLSYYIGMIGGTKLINSYGKYLLIDHDDLEKTQKWFQKRGEITIFIARLVPVVRHLISLAAGIAQMNKKKFLLYTLIGATIWNTLLIYLGFILGQNWNEVSTYLEEISLVIVILLIIGVFYYIYRHLQKRAKRSKEKST